MVDLNGFNAEEVEPRGVSELIPAGQYLAAITGSEMRQTKRGDGEYLQLTFQILEGEHQGRNLWTRLNLKSPTAIAVQIARQDLSAICRAVGVLHPKDSAELHDLPMVIAVRQKPRDDTGEQKNVISGFRAKARQQSTPGHGEPPWRKRHEK